jgi:surface antigen
MRPHVLRIVISSTLLLAVPAAAQFGSFPIRIPTTKSEAQALTDPGCKTSKKGKGAAILGKIAGNAASRTLNRTSMSRFVPVSEFSSTLTQSIACRLDPEEQKKAAVATDEALRGNKVGKSTTWQSDTRENVTGTSTVTAAAAPPPGGPAKTKCMIVTDFIIVDGEETRAEKKMCKAPGEARYSIATA